MLRDFDLAAPGGAREIGSDFGFATRSVAALYARMFNAKIGGKAYRKLLVEVVPTVEREHVINMLGVAVVQIPGDAKAFLKLTDEQKLKQSLRMLMDGVSKAAQQLGWPMEPFDSAAKRVVQCNYKNEWTWKSKWNRGRQLAASVVVLHTPKDVTIKLCVCDKVGLQVASIVAGVCQPHELIFNEYLGSLCWTNDRTVQFMSKQGEQLASLDVPVVPAVQGSRKTVKRS